MLSTKLVDANAVAAHPRVPQVTSWAVAQHQVRRFSFAFLLFMFFFFLQNIF
jgi:hypothetical protein